MYESAGFTRLGYVTSTTASLVPTASPHAGCRQRHDAVIHPSIESSCTRQASGICDWRPTAPLRVSPIQWPPRRLSHGVAGVLFVGVVPMIALARASESLCPTMRRALAPLAGLPARPPPRRRGGTIVPGWQLALGGVAAAKKRRNAPAWEVPFLLRHPLGWHLAADVYEHGPLPETRPVGVLATHQRCTCGRLASLWPKLGSTVDDPQGGLRHDRHLLGLDIPGRHEVLRRPWPVRRPEAIPPARHDRAT